MISRRVPFVDRSSDHGSRYLFKQVVDGAFREGEIEDVIVHRKGADQ